MVKKADDMLGLKITFFYFGLFGICCLSIFTATGISHIYENGKFYPGLLLFNVAISSLGVLSAIFLALITRYLILDHFIILCYMYRDGLKYASKVL